MTRRHPTTPAGRSPSRRWFLLAAALPLLGGCVLASTPSRPVPAGPLAPIRPGQDGGPPFECRGVPDARCAEFAITPDDPDSVGVVRIIVTCTAVCSGDSGRVRIDALDDQGAVSELAQGVYGE